MIDREERQILEEALVSRKLTVESLYELIEPEFAAKYGFKSELIGYSDEFQCELYRTTLPIKNVVSALLEIGGIPYIIAVYLNYYTKRCLSLTSSLKYKLMYPGKSW